MQPITYSLVLNVLTFLVCSALAYYFNQPLLVVVALLMQSHALERFQDKGDDEDEDEDEPSMGFTAEVSKK